MHVSAAISNHPLPTFATAAACIAALAVLMVHNMQHPSSELANAEPGSSSTGAGMDPAGSFAPTELFEEAQKRYLLQAEEFAIRVQTVPISAPISKETNKTVLLLSAIVQTTPPSAIINGKAVHLGETAKIQSDSGVLAIKCLRIEKDFVTISVEGEETPRNLHLKDSSSEK
jgi:hypothetical protein